MATADARRGCCFIAAAAIMTATIVLPAQNPPGERRFDVASIKRSPPYAERVLGPFIGVPEPGIWRMRDEPLLVALRNIYPGHQFPGQIAGAPDWVNQDFYDIEARYDAGATPEDIRRMARTLMAERFKLALHQERRNVPAFVLMTRKGGKLGSGLRPPAVDCTEFRTGGPLPSDPTRKQFADRRPCAATALPVFDQTRVIPGADMRLTAGDVPIESVLTLLGNFLNRPVVNRTGLTQHFDIELQFLAGPVRPDSDNGPPLRAAIAEQLGLEVQNGRASVDVLVIDRIDRPSEN